MGASVNQAEPFLRQIPAGWHDVGEYTALIEGWPAMASISGVPLLVTRTADTVTVMLGHCAHETGPLGDGQVSEINGAACVTCPWHGSAFRLSDGKVVRGPAATDQPLLRSRVVDGRVEAALP
jgi:nitrite reductase/ring-hydroxylating ferredoxin subunit